MPFNTLLQPPQCVNRAATQSVRQPSPVPLTLLGVRGHLLAQVVEGVRLGVRLDHASGCAVEGEQAVSGTEQHAVQRQRC